MDRSIRRMVGQQGVFKEGLVVSRSIRSGILTKRSSAIPRIDRPEIRSIDFDFSLAGVASARRHSTTIRVRFRQWKP